MRSNISGTTALAFAIGFAAGLSALTIQTRLRLAIAEKLDIQTEKPEKKPENIDTSITPDGKVKCCGESCNVSAPPPEFKPSVEPAAEPAKYQLIKRKDGSLWHVDKLGNVFNPNDYCKIVGYCNSKTFEITFTDKIPIISNKYRTILVEDDGIKTQYLMDLIGNIFDVDDCSTIIGFYYEKTSEVEFFSNEYEDAEHKET